MVTISIAFIFTIIFMLSMVGASELHETCDYTGKILLMDFYPFSPFAIYGYLIYNYFKRVDEILHDEIMAFLTIVWKVLVAAANAGKKSLEENQ